MMTGPLFIHFQIQKEDMIGRKTTTDTFIPFKDRRCHIQCAHVVQDSAPVNVFTRHPRVFRVSMPYGHVKHEPAREEGLMYLHLSNSLEAFQSILKNIAGEKKGSALGEVTIDQLISSVQPLQGSFWYLPSADELQLPTVKERR